MVETNGSSPVYIGGNDGMGFGNGNSNSNAIQADVNRGFDNQNLQAQTRDIMSAVTSGTAQSVAAADTANGGFNYIGSEI